MIERDAIETLYRERYKDLVAFARRRLKVPGKAEDAVHDAFSRALLPLTRPPRVNTALYTYLRGFVRDAVKKYNTIDARELHYVEEHEGPRAPCGGGFRILPKPNAE